MLPVEMHPTTPCGDFHPCSHITLRYLQVLSQKEGAVPLFRGVLPLYPVSRDGTVIVIELS